MTERARAWASVESAGTYRATVTNHLTALGLDHHHLAVANSVMGEWADKPVTELAPSFAANDGSPVEFSFALTRSGTETRMGFESLDTPARLTNHHFVRRLRDDLGIDVTRLALIEDLFAPAGGLFSMFCATAFRAGGPLFKVYLDPAARGEPHRAVGEAMHRLGLNAPWDRLGSPHQEIAVFALDLGTAPEARVKLYLRHTGTDPADLERVSALADDHEPDLFTKILTRVYGHPTTDLPKAPMTCLAFRGSSPHPASATLYCPLDPNLAHDAEAAARVLDLLEMSGIAPDPFHTLATTISGPDLTRGHRLSWLSYKQPEDPVVTLYAGLDGSPR